MSRCHQRLSFSVYSAEELAGEEIVSDMIYNFVLQDVEKQIVRDKMRKRQTSYLRNAHAAIYNKILELPAIERSLPNPESLHAEENPGEEAQAPDQVVEVSNCLFEAEKISLSYIQ